MSLRVEDWGFEAGEDGALVIGGLRAESLAREFGTPLHVVDVSGLRRRASRLRDAFESAYAGQVTAYYALKCNNTPRIVRMILDEGLQPEVGTPYEWCLARRLGAQPGEIMINGPNKGALLRTAVVEGAGLIVVDGPQELDDLEALCRSTARRARILMRVNPNSVPKGMNRASATGSRKASVFGFDLISGEVSQALERIAGSPSLQFAGLHSHVGTGVRRARDYQRPLKILVNCAAEAWRYGLKVDVINVGGGFGVPTSRELDTLEFLLYQGIGRLPKPPDPRRFPPIENFAAPVADTIQAGCERHGLPLPRLVVEPGRAIVSGAGVLLLSVGAVKERPGVGTWVITDGAAGTVAFPLYYEYHEVFLCSAVHAPRSERYSLVGPVCFSADWIYRNKRMPPIVPGDVLAVCDAGAYFTVQESNFGFPRPPIVAVRDGKATLLRRRETFEDMVSRDIGWGGGDEP
jgi:diaminopimelate decarboxylase